MSGKKPVSFRATENMEADIEAHQARKGFDTKGDAVQHLVQVGLRESNGPRLYELRESVHTAALVLACAAISILILGVAGYIFTTSDAMIISSVFLIVGGSLVAAIEFARTMNGQNELGGQLLGGRL